MHYLPRTHMSVSKKPQGERGDTSAAIPGELTDIPKLAPLDKSKAPQVVGGQEANGYQQRYPSNHQVADS